MDCVVFDTAQFNRYILDYLSESSITQSDNFRCFRFDLFLKSVQVCGLTILIDGQVWKNHIEEGKSVFIVEGVFSNRNCVYLYSSCMQCIFNWLAY